MRPMPQRPRQTPGHHYAMAGADLSKLFAWRRPAARDWQLAARVELLVHRLEPLAVDVGVDLGGGDVGVA
jgi:hypothetical protein